MVIVVNHILAYAIIYLRDAKRFKCRDDSDTHVDVTRSPELEACPDDRSKQQLKLSFSPVAASFFTPETVSLNTIQDACLRFLDVTTVDELRTAIKDVLNQLLPDPHVCLVYLTDPSSGELYTEDGLSLSQFLPHQGICWKALNSQQGIVQSTVDPKDPVVTAIKCHYHDSPVSKISPVLSYPVIDIKQNSVVALIVTAGANTNIKDLVKLQAIEKQIVACFRRLCRKHHPVRQTSTNTEALVKLCGELYDHDASVLQLKVIKYLEEQTSAECSFLLLVVPDTQELFCQVVGDRVLSEEIRFPGHSSSFATALETQQPIVLEDVPLDKRKGIEEFLDKKLQSFLCVPVTSRNNDNLISLVCVANKIGADRFTEDDIFSIHQCFRYTATVLTSTLAYQNERKLKLQTQAMLQVARNLFTHLGELLHKNTKHLDTFPIIRSGMVEVNVAGWSFSDYLCFNKIKHGNQCKVGSKNEKSCNNNSSVGNLEVEKLLKQQEKIANSLADTSTGLLTSSPDKSVRYKHSQCMKSPDKLPKVHDHDIHPPYRVQERKKEEQSISTFEQLEETRSLCQLGTDLDNLGQNQLSLILDSGSELVPFEESVNLSDLSQSDWTNERSEKTENFGDICQSPLLVGHLEVEKQLKQQEKIANSLADTSTGPLTSSPDKSVRYKHSQCMKSPDKLPTVHDHDIHPPYRVQERKKEKQLTSTFAQLKKTKSPNIELGQNQLSLILDSSCKLVPFEESVNLSDLSLSDWMIEQSEETESFGDSCQSLLSYTTAPDYSSLSEDETDFPVRSHNTTFEGKSFYEDNTEINLNPKGSHSQIDLKVQCYPQCNTEDLVDSDNSVQISNSEPNVVCQDLLCKIVPPYRAPVSYQHSPMLPDKDRVSKEELCCVNPAEVEQSRIQIVVEDSDSSLLHSISLSLIPNLYIYTSDKNHLLSSGSTEYLRRLQAPSTEVEMSQEHDLTKLLREIMQEARNLTHAERCSVFLIDDQEEELVAKVFDGIQADDDEVETEIRLPITQGIAGHVATAGQLLNIRDAYSHPLFYRGMDDSTGFRTRNILCFPLKDENGVVLGVAQLCNKKNGQCFTTFDEELALAFAVYCCISISHTLQPVLQSMMYQKVVDAQYRNNLANELMMYHMKCLMYKKLQTSQHRSKLANELMIYHMQVSNEDVEGLTKTPILPPQDYHPDFAKFTYAPRSISENSSLEASLSMFEDLGFNSKWRIKIDTLARFVLMVKKGYRNPPYHNWMHAYTVSHFCFLLVKNLHLENYLDDIEIFALFVSCFCHDIDHRGTNNSFQVASKSVLAALYSSEGSVMERHHFAQTMCIVNTEGCNIFENLSSKDYQKVLDLIRDIILATDLAHHLRILKNLQEMARVGYDKTKVKYRKMLLCLLMTSCDLSDQTKCWDNIKRIAGLIYREFFSQGDVEKELGVEPIEMMDRERAQIPDLQISFLDHIATPLFKLLADVFPEAIQVSDTVEENRHHWVKVKELLSLRSQGSTSKMTLDEVLSVDDENSPEVFDESPIHNGQ